MYLPWDHSVFPKRGRAVKLRVIRVWKGNDQPGSLIETRTPLMESFCGYPAKVGEEIVIYSDETYRSEFGLCNASLPGHAGEVMMALDSMAIGDFKRDGTQQSVRAITGRIYQVGSR